MGSARRITLATMGTIVALAGFEHGLGELLQGPVAPASMFIQSWPDAAFYRSLQGEPAMTVIPNLAVSGIASMTLSLVFLAWVTRSVERRHGALVIAALAIAMLLVGGGFGPPVLGLVLAIPAIKVTSPLHGWRRRTPHAVNRVAAAAWRPLLVACVAAWLMALVGIAAFDYFLAVESTALTLAVLAAAFGLLPLAILSSFARDAAEIARHPA